MNRVNKTGSSGMCAHSKGKKYGFLFSVCKTYLILAVAFFAASNALAATTSDASLDDYNVAWTSPSSDSSGSMPLGNGDVGLNVWAEADGDLLFYIGKTDAYCGIGRLLKLGRVRVKFNPNPFAKGLPFAQTLRLRQGRVEFLAGKDGSQVSVKVWVDANRPVIHVDVEGQEPLTVEAMYETWREKPRIITSEVEKDSAGGIIGGNISFLVEADTIIDEATDRIIFYHRNNTSIWRATLEHQALGRAALPENDPLLHRTFGGLIQGEGFIRADHKTLRSAEPAVRQSFSIAVLTQKTDTPEQWTGEIEQLAVRCDKTSPEQAAAEHERWWSDFWNRSHVFVSPAAALKDENDRNTPTTITCGYVLQRYMAACSGRGNLPIKFNGSIFTVDGNENGERFDADFRRWGGAFWFQNTRLPYWAMLAAGDFDMMRPLFDMYLKALPLAKLRANTYYKHGGAYFPETMYFWGTPRNRDYSLRRPNWQRGDVPDGEVLNPYIKYYWSGGIELCVMGLELYDYSQDREFLEKTLLPLATAIIEFYDLHYLRDASGKIRFAPAASLETWHVAENPLPEIAGLTVLLKQMLQLPDDATTEDERARWRRMAVELPPLPLQSENGKTWVLPAESFSELSNSENPELYAVFPYRIFGLGKPNIDVGIETFNRRRVKSTGCWMQDAIQAAYLGLTDTAAEYVAKNFSTKNEASRFPAFWGPNYDYVPDQDHGGVAMKALQTMLVQAEDNKIYLLPAWPSNWNVEFKLHAAQNTTVACVYADGKVQSLIVAPKSREKDVVLMKTIDPKIDDSNAN